VFSLIGQYEFRPEANSLVALFAIGIVDSNIGYMNMIIKKTAFPSGIPIRPMFWIIGASRPIRKKFIRIFKISMDIGTGKWYSHLAKWRLQVTILWGIGRLAANLTLPMPKMMKKPSPHMIYERWLSCCIDNIPSFSIL